MKQKLFMINTSSSPAPEYKTSGSAGMDLRANKGVVIAPMTQEVFGTGIYVQIPEGYEGQVRSRSGFSTENQTIITTGVGTIDSDYRGEIGVCMFNLSNTPVVICEGDRVAQLVISPVEQVEIVLTSELPDTERGTGGFGSSGLK